MTNQQKLIEEFREKFPYRIYGVAGEPKTEFLDAKNKPEQIESFLLHAYEEGKKDAKEEIGRWAEKQKEKPIQYDGSNVCTHYQENCSCSPSKEKCRKHNQRVTIKNSALNDLQEYLAQK